MSEHHEHVEEWDGIERRRSSQTGFALNSWPSVLSFLSVCLTAVGGLSWGLKLESRIDKCIEAQQVMRDRIEDEMLHMRAVLDRGILPITQVRLDSLEAQIKDMKGELDACLKRH